MKDKDLQNQVTINTTDIKWIKNHMKTQTGLLLMIFGSIISAIGYLVNKFSDLIF